MKIRIFKVLLVLLLGFSQCAYAPDEVTIPGYPYTGKTYSGYLQLGNSQRFLHYVFHPSSRDPINDPVVLWLNGGPGCSSLLGWVMEHGPAILQDDGSMKLNEYAWNKVSNIIYLESPVGVGFSYTNDGDLNSDDQKSAKENLEAVISFFNKFPEFRRNDFHIAGESYAGIYIPTLASYILDYNQAAEASSKVNLKGLMIGNGVTDWKIDTEPALYDFAFTHALYSTEVRKRYEQLCLQTKNPGAECEAVKEEISSSFNGINIYDIYLDCYVPPKSYQLLKLLQREKISVSYPYTPWLKLNKGQKLRDTPPCVNMQPQIDYFTRPDIIKALKVKNGLNWQPCSDNINYTVDYERGSFYLYPKLFLAKLKIFIFSGDTDGAVPINGTLKWISNLNLKVTKKWRAWKFNKQVAGYTQSYKELQFVSIKGVGHTVPMYTPPRAFYFYSKYLSGEDL